MISSERLSHLTSLIIDGLWKDDLVDYKDDDQAMRVAKRAAQNFYKEMQDIDDKVKVKISSLKRGVVEGSSEWDVLYGKYYEEELERRGHF